MHASLATLQEQMNLTYSSCLVTRFYSCLATGLESLQQLNESTSAVEVIAMVHWCSVPRILKKKNPCTIGEQWNPPLWPPFIGPRCGRSFTGTILPLLKGYFFLPKCGCLRQVSLYHTFQPLLRDHLRRVHLHSKTTFSWPKRDRLMQVLLYQAITGWLSNCYTRKTSLYWLLLCITFFLSRHWSAET
jgi:hypothetical protein